MIYLFTFVTSLLTPAAPAQQGARTADTKRRRRWTGSRSREERWAKRPGWGCNFGGATLGITFEQLCAAELKRNRLPLRGTRENRVGQAVFHGNKPGHLGGWGGGERPGGGALKGGGRRKGGSTCLPFLQEPPGLVSTNRLMSPKLVLHVLVAQGFEVGGQRAVQQQDAPVQGPHPRDVRGRHSAARGPGAADRACAQGGARRLRAGDRGARGPAEVGVRPLTGLVRPKIRIFRKRSFGGGAGHRPVAVGAGRGVGSEPLKGSVRVREDANDTIGLSQLSPHSHTPSSLAFIFLAALLIKA